jgi:hypothetical protein
MVTGIEVTALVGPLVSAATGAFSSFQVWRAERRRKKAKKCQALALRDVRNETVNRFVLSCCHAADVYFHVQDVRD